MHCDDINFNVIRCGSISFHTVFVPMHCYDINFNVIRCGSISFHTIVVPVHCDDMYIPKSMFCDWLKDEVKQISIVRISFFYVWNIFARIKFSAIHLLITIFDCYLPTK